MPIYEYQCQKCGTFEATQRITDKPLAKCPTCKGKVKKLISNIGYNLKKCGKGQKQNAYNHHGVQKYN